MSDDRQPEAEWVFAGNNTKKSNQGRNWLIAILVIVAVAIVSVPLYFLLASASEAEPTPSSTASASASPTPTSTPISTPTATPGETTEPEPDPTQPAVPDPDLGTFTEQVQPRLDDAVRGLQLVTDNIDLGAQIVDSLQQDATLLSDAVAPSSIAGDWSSAVSQYATSLNELRKAYDTGADPQQPLDAAGAALQKVRAVVGL